MRLPGQRQRETVARARKALLSEDMTPGARKALVSLSEALQARTKQLLSVFAVVMLLFTGYAVRLQVAQHRLDQQQNRAERNTAQILANFDSTRAACLAVNRTNAGILAFIERSYLTQQSPPPGSDPSLVEAYRRGAEQAKISLADARKTFAVLPCPPKTQPTPNTPPEPEPSPVPYLPALSPSPTPSAP